jgi:hypothetical protein
MNSKNSNKGNNRRAQPPASLTHAIQKKGGIAYAEEPPFNYQAVSGAFREEAENLVRGSGNIYVVDRGLMDIAVEKTVDRLNLDETAEARRLQQTVSALGVATIFEFPFGGDWWAAMIVPAKYPSRIGSLNDRDRFYFMHNMPNRDAESIPYLMPVAAIASQPQKSAANPLTLVSFGYELDDDQRVMMQMQVRLALLCTEILQNEAVPLLRETSDFRTENRLRRQRRKEVYSPVTSLRVDAAAWAVIEETRTHAQHMAAFGYTYEFPFVVDNYTRPSDGREVNAHAKGGTPEQRAVLNDFLAAGNEVGLRQALFAYNSPQSARPVLLKLGTKRGKPAPGA